MAKIPGQLEGAQLENLSSDPSNLPDGRAWYNTTTKVAKVALDGAAKQLSTIDGIETLTNKTISGSSNTITDVDAQNVINTPSGNLAATDLQSALNELQTDIDSRALSTTVSNHILDTEDAHNASAISFTPAGTVAATEVQAAIEEVATDAAAALATHEADTSSHGVTGAVVGTTDTQTLTNKTLTSPAVNTPTVDVMTLTEQGSTPSNPASGELKFYSKTDDKLYFLNSDGIEQEVGSGAGSGVKNYIEGGDAEDGLIGAVYDDSTSANPVDGTGGASIQASISTTTSDPLSGTTSLLYTPGPFAGEGWSVDFDIDREDMAKVLSVDLSYEITGTGYTDGKMQIWIVAPSGEVIQPVGYSILNAIGPQKHRATFQTESSGTNYKLCLHQTSGTATYGFKFEVSVSPQVVSTGGIATATTSYTPTVTGFTPAGTSAVSKVTQWRTGDRINLEIYMHAGSTGSGTATTLAYSLPTGVTLDTNAMARTTGQAGYGGYWFDASASDWKAIIARPNSTGTAINILILDGTSVTAMTGSDLAANDEIIVSGNWPVVGWGVSQILSSETDTRVVAMTANLQTPTGTLNGGGFNVTKFGTVSYDTHGGYNTSTGQYTVKVPGFYEVSYALEIGHTAVTESTAIGGGVYKGTTASGGFSRAFTGSTAVLTLNVTGTHIVYCNAGETLEVRGYSTGTSPTYTPNIAGSSLAIRRLSGASQIAASESVGLLYRGAPPTGTLNSSFNITTFGTRAKDSHSIYSSGGATIPVSGQYDISAQVAIAATFAAGNYAGVSVFVDGTEYDTGYLQAGSSSVTQLHPQVNVRALPLLAGQVVTIRSTSNGTTPSFVSNAAGNRFSLVRTGNY